MSTKQKKKNNNNSNKKSKKKNKKSIYSTVLRKMSLNFTGWRGVQSAAPDHRLATDWHTFGALVWDATTTTTGNCCLLPLASLARCLTFVSHLYCCVSRSLVH